MNLEHLSSKLRLDIDHLLWQQRTQHLTPDQFRERFNTIARGYCSLVPQQDRAEVQQLVERYKASLLH
ncbi:hypothetical protein [Motiliproteus sediminis]|uniref:hypothetical protein n=1 Tax=Motiliproteus sediminis TaxID=1468178 RepID=UPI001AEF9AF7|nr:hypothetical protein [Motiliproteus sediminis]